MSRMTTKTKRYGSLIKSGQCSTRGWNRGLTVSPGVRRWSSRSPGNARLLEQLIRKHELSMPYELRAGYEFYTELDLGEDEDSIFCMTSCGSHAAWDRARAGKLGLRSLVAFPSEF